MALVTKNFTLNVTPGAMPPTIHVSEYDVGRTYTITLLDENGSAFEIPTGTTAAVEGTLNGTYGFTTSATISGNQISFALTESMTAYAGNAWCKIKLTLNSEPIQTCAFILAVDRAGVEAETVIGAPGFEEQIQGAVDAYMDEHPASDADSALSDTSEKPVQNKVITAKINEINNRFEQSGGSEGSSNLLNPEEVVEGYYITNTNDQPATNASYWYSGYIPVEVGKTYSFQRGNLTVTSGRTTEYFKWLAAYDAQKNLLSAKGSTQAKQYTVPDGAAYVRICANITFSPVSHYTTFVEGTTVLDYEPYEEPTEGVAVLKAENNNTLYINELIEAYVAEHPVAVSVDSSLSNASENPVQNKVVTAAINGIASMFEEEQETQGSYNLLNPAEAVNGYYITNANDTPQANANYWYSGFIPVEVGKTYTGQRGNQTVAQGRNIMGTRWIAAYDANKVLKPSLGSSSSAQSYTVPEGVAFVRICVGAIDYSPIGHYTTYVEGTELRDYTEYVAPSGGNNILKAENNNAPYINGLIDAKFEAKNNIPFGFSHSFSLASGATYSIEYSMQDKLGYCMTFRGDIAADFQGVIMSHGYQIQYGGYVKVTPTLVEYYLGTESSPRISVEHGLTLTDYVSIVLNANAVNKMDLAVYTNGGSFERTGLAWDVCRGYLRAQSVGTTTMQNCKLSYWCKDWAASTHLFGDSYFSMYADRWTYYLRNAGFNDNLINGYGGRTAQDALPVAKTVLDHSQPKRIVWCLGMNNADSGAVNANWKLSVEELAAICDARNIEFILATIPNVASVDNTYKNAYVRASGRRYIDFAAAVGASSDTTWYSGMLSSDGTHPTAQGAIGLYTQAIADVPELAT